MRFKINTYNMGKFTQHQVVDNKYNPPRALITVKTKEEAHEFIREECRRILNENESPSSAPSAR